MIVQTSNACSLNPPPLKSMLHEQKQLQLHLLYGKGEEPLEVENGHEGRDDPPPTQTRLTLGFVFVFMDPI